MNKTAIVTGVTGQDGSYLSELLLSKGYLVYGCHRRTSTPSTHRISRILNNPDFQLIEFDLTDPSGIHEVISGIKPHEFYNLAAQSHVGTSFKQPNTTFDIDCNGVIHILEAIKQHSPGTRFYQASTSEMFGRNYSQITEDGKKYQDENTSMLPQSPYGVAKLASHHMVTIYRDAYNLFATSGILFNHESPRRGENFVTRKITKYLGEYIKNPHIPTLKLGNLAAYRDWGHAKDYVRAMHLMLQAPEPSDYVISSGDTYSVQHFLDLACEMAGLDEDQTDELYEIDPEFFRPCEVDYLCGDSSKARNDLGWTQEYTFEKLVEDMLRHDCGGRADLVKSAKACCGTGKKSCRSTNNTREKFDQQSKDGFGFYTGN
jgi:GDPmannose 4,6-dehydratase